MTATTSRRRPRPIGAPQSQVRNLRAVPTPPDTSVPVLYDWAAEPHRPRMLVEIDLPTAAYALDFARRNSHLAGEQILHHEAIDRLTHAVEGRP